MEKKIEFLCEPLPDYLCPVCADPLTEPYLTDCGHHFCYMCCSRLLTRGLPDCPMCRERQVLARVRLNKHFQRQVNSLKVRCQHHEVGCQWVGELRYLQEHLDPVMRKCGFDLLACPFGCGKRFHNSAMKDHILINCRKRFYICEHCSYCNKFDIVTEQHYPVCEQFPVECPNRCSVAVNLKRQELVCHLEEQCPLQVIQCPFTSAGCTVQLPRREMEEHVHDPSQHLHMVQEPPTIPAATTNWCSRLSKFFSSLRLRRKPAAVPNYLINLPPVEFVITEFTEKKEGNTEWVSPPFYSHPQGYKLCLTVFPNGIYTGKGRYVSVAVDILDGGFERLSWPFEADIEVELLNWRQDNGHQGRMLYCCGRSNQVSLKEYTTSSMIFPSFCHSSLSYNSTTNTEYLQNDCVRLRVSKVILYSTALLNKTPSWQNPHNGYQSLYEFTLTDFTKRYEFKNICYSTPFYTHHHGYKFYLDVRSNICIGNDRYISVYLWLTPGEYDDQLEWPFIGNFDIELLNWMKDDFHLKTRISITASDDFTKPNDHSSCKYKSLENSTCFSVSSIVLRTQAAEIGRLKDGSALFWLDDCLRFRVNMQTN